MSFFNTLANSVGSAILGEIGSGKQSNTTPAKFSEKYYGTDWAQPSLFGIEWFYMKNANMGNPNNKKHFFRNSASYGTIKNLIDTSVTSIETATITHAPIEEWIGGTWVYTTGRPELRQVTFTFRETSEAWLYRNFNTAYNASRNDYPDYQKWALKVWLHGATASGDVRMDVNLDNASVKGALLETHEAIIESISPIQLDTTDVDGFVTFSVTFKYMNPVHNVSNISINASGIM